MKTKKHPRDLSDADVEAMVSAFDANADDAYSVTESATLAELRARRPRSGPLLPAVPMPLLAALPASRTR